MNISSLAGETAPLPILRQYQLLLPLTRADLPCPATGGFSCAQVDQFSVELSVGLRRWLGFSPWEVLSSLALCTAPMTLISLDFRSHLFTQAVL